MKCAVHSTFGDPALVLAPGDLPTPEPGEGQVRIRTILSPIHNHDLLTVWGTYGYKPDLPAIGGSEAVGAVDALGPGVTGVNLGQRIAVAAVNGTWAEYFIAPAASLVPLPETISDEQGAQLIAMPFSALTLLEFLGVEKGDWVIQNAANGAVGKALAMIGAARGINVISLVRRDAAIAELGQLGIGNVISTETADWPERAAALAGGSPIKAAVDSVGGETCGRMFGLLGENSLLVVFGSLTGEDLPIPAGDLIFKQATVKGFWGSKVAASLGPDGVVRLVGELIRLVAQGLVRLPVDGIYTLDQVSDAMTASIKPGKAGKVLLRP